MTEGGSSTSKEGQGAWRTAPSQASSSVGRTVRSSRPPIAHAIAYSAARYATGCPANGGGNERNGSNATRCTYASGGPAMDSRRSSSASKCGHTRTLPFGCNTCTLSRWSGDLCSDTACGATRSRRRRSHGTARSNGTGHEHGVSSGTGNNRSGQRSGARGKDSIVSRCGLGVA